MSRKHKKRKHRKILCGICSEPAVVRLTARFKDYIPQTFNCCSECWAQGMGVGARFSDIQPIT